MDKRINKIKTFFLIISLTIFIVSLTQNALSYFDFDGLKTHSSFSLLIMGGIAILGGGLLEWFIWLSNPIYFLALIYFFKSSKVSMMFSIIATFLALSFASWNEILAAENGRNARIESLNIGYWLWVISFAILSIGTIYYFIKIKKINDN